MARQLNKKKNSKSARAAAQSALGSRTASSPANDPRRKPPLDSQNILLSIILFLVVLTVFWPCTNNNFTDYDDPEYVTENTHVKQGLSAQSVAWAFESGEQANWHPLTWISHMLDCQFYGLKPSGHHATSVLLHSINAVLLFLVLNLMLGARWKCLAAAALFALHPLRVESVAWVAERKDVLSTAFWLLTIWAYVRFSRALKAGAGYRLFYGLALLFFTFGLMSKPMVVTLPFVLLLLDYWPLQRIESRTWRNLLLEKIPYLALAAISCVITYKVQQSGGAVHGNIPFPMRLETTVISYFRYLGKIIWPGGLCIYYPYPTSWPVAEVYASVSALVGISLAVVVWRKKLPWLGVGWFWYVGTLVPVIGLVQAGTQSMADRYTYIPSIGIMVMLVWGASEIGRRWRLPGNILAVMSVILPVACISLTRQQIGYWQNSKAAFAHALEVTTNNEVAYTHLTYILFGSGQRTEAIQLLEEAVKTMPDSSAIHNNLGMFYKEQRRYPEAETQLHEALRLKPDYPEAQVGLAYICLKDGRRDEAIARLKQALQSSPDLKVAQKMLRQATADAPN